MSEGGLDDVPGDHTLHVKRTGPHLVHRRPPAPVVEEPQSRLTVWRVLRAETDRARARIPFGCGGCQHGVWTQKHSVALTPQEPGSSMTRDPKVFQYLFEPNVSCTAGARPSPAGVAYCSHSTAVAEAAGDD